MSATKLVFVKTGEVIDAPAGMNVQAAIASGKFTAAPPSMAEKVAAARSGGGGILSGIARLADPSAYASPEAMAKGPGELGRAMVPIIRDAGPPLAGMAAAALIPETGGASALLPWALRAGARTLLSGGAAGVTDLAGQLASGESPDIGHAAGVAGTNSLLQGVGEGIAGIVGAGGDALAMDAAGANKVSRAALPRYKAAVLRERVPVGPSPLTELNPGSAETAAREAAVAADAKALLEKAGPSGKVPGTPGVKGVRGRPGVASSAPALPIQGAAAPTAQQVALAKEASLAHGEAISAAAEKYSIPPTTMQHMLTSPLDKTLLDTADTFGMPWKDLVSLRNRSAALTEANGTLAAAAAPTPSGVIAGPMAPPTAPVAAKPAVKATPPTYKNPGINHDTNDLLSGVDKKIAELKQSAHPDDAAMATELQHKRDAFAARNPKGLSPIKMDRAVRSSQRNTGDTIYRKNANGETVASQNTPANKTFHNLVAKKGRLMNRDAVKELAALKDRAQELRVMTKTYKSNEATPPPKLSTLGNPTQIVPTIARRSLLAPNVSSRVGFAMNDPRTLLMLREGLLGGTALNGLLNPPQPDTTQGGSR